MLVGVAQPARGEPYQHFAFARTVELDLLDRPVLADAPEHRCRVLHGENATPSGVACATWPSARDSAGETAINRDNGAGDRRRRRRAQKCHHRGHLRRRRAAGRDRRAGRIRLALARLVDLGRGRQDRGVGRAGVDDVRGDGGAARGQRRACGPVRPPRAWRRRSRRAARSGSVPAADDTATNRPAGLVSRCGTAARARWKTPVRLTSSMASHCGVGASPRPAARRRSCRRRRRPRPARRSARRSRRRRRSSAALSRTSAMTGVPPVRSATSCNCSGPARA